MNELELITKKELRIKKPEVEIFEIKSRLNSRLREEYIKMYCGKVFKNNYGSDIYTYVMEINANAQSFAGIEFNLDSDEVMISPVAHTKFSELDLNNPIEKLYISDLLKFKTNEFLNIINK